MYRGLRHVSKRVPLGIIEMLAKISNRKPTERMVCLAFYRMEAFNAKNGIAGEGEKSEWFREKTELEFEGFPFYVGKEYMTYLQSKYKNMWEYPPESGRRIHPPKSYSLDVEIDLRGRDVEEYMKKEYLYLTKEDWEKERKK